MPWRAIPLVSLAPNPALPAPTEKFIVSRVILGVNGIEASRKFYDALLRAVVSRPGVYNHNGVATHYYHSPTGLFGITTPINGEPATHSNGSTIGFAMQSPEQADT